MLQMLTVMIEMSQHMLFGCFFVFLFHFFKYPAVLTQYRFCAVVAGIIKDSAKMNQVIYMLKQIFQMSVMAEINQQLMKFLV